MLPTAVSTHHLYFCLSVCLSICLSVRSFVCLSVRCLSVHLSGCLPAHPFVCLSIRLSVCLSIRLSVCLSIRLSVHLSVCPSACLPIRLSVCLSICRSVCLCMGSICQRLPNRFSSLSQRIQDLVKNNSTSSSLGFNIHSAVKSLPPIRLGDDETLRPQSLSTFSATKGKP